jgi:hypothetical protein
MREFAPEVFDRIFEFFSGLPRLFFDSRIGISHSPPTFDQVILTYSEIPEIQNRMIKKFEESYIDALERFKEFNPFYELFHFGEKCKASRYLNLPNDQPYERSFSIFDCAATQKSSEFLVHPENEPLIKLELIRKDIQKIRGNDNNVSLLSSQLSSVHVIADSVHIKGILQTLPIISLDKIRKVLSDYFSLKVELLTKVISDYSLQMKIDINNLKSFVQFCAILNQIEQVNPLIVETISIVDQIEEISQYFNLGQLHHSLHKIYNNFMIDYQSIQEVKNNNLPVYSSLLHGDAYRINQMLTPLVTKSQFSSQSFVDFDVKAYLDSVSKIRQELKTLKVQI